MADDTVEGQWELAEWCRKNGLAKQREVHLRRIVELDPNHQQARFALGYQFLKGEWITRSDARRQEGYEFYRGKWRTPQEIEMLEIARAERTGREGVAGASCGAGGGIWTTANGRSWRMSRWSAINDPIAVRPLGECFCRERVRSVKYLYADILARINTDEAITVLVERALGDPDEEVFYYCLGKLAQLQPPHVSDPFVAALKDNDNARVNRAAIGAGAAARQVGHFAADRRPGHDALAGDRYGRSTRPPALAAAHRRMERATGWSCKIYHVHNQPVLDALSKLTGADFGFDKAAWRYWYAQEKIAAEAERNARSVRCTRRQISLNSNVMIHEVNHPLIKHHLSRLRDKQTHAGGVSAAGAAAVGAVGL